MFFALGYQFFSFLDSFGVHNSIWNKNELKWGINIDLHHKAVAQEIKKVGAQNVRVFENSRKLEKIVNELS